jgi:hypothetical protein
VLLHDGAGPRAYFLDDVRFGGSELLVQNAAAAEEPPTVRLAEARQARIRIRDPQPLTSPEQFAI